MEKGHKLNVRGVGTLMIGFILTAVASCAQQATTINYPSHNGLLMCGYQGWFKAPGDEAGNKTWWHYGKNGKFDPEHITIDLWPDMSEYVKSYPTDFQDDMGKQMNIFSSMDYSSIDMHFKWMKEYGIDGVFMQRFYYYVKDKKVRGAHNNLVLSNALKASQKYDRAMALMYDLSGLTEDANNLNDVIEDWKFLVDEIGILDDKTNYLHHRGKPLIAIWGVGFRDRPYDIQKIQTDKFIDFLKNDPKYGGLSVMLGVPTHFRTQTKDCIEGSYFHELIKKADIIQPWYVGRFDMNDLIKGYYGLMVSQDLSWCESNGVDCLPTVYPGFSWYNLRGGEESLNAIPRLKGQFFGTQIDQVIKAGAKMIYVAMFDEVDEGTAIFKVTNSPPVNATFADNEGLPSDYYLKLAGQAALRLKSTGE